MNKEIFKWMETKENEILEKHEKLNEEILEIIKCTTGVSREFEESMIDNITDILHTLKSVNIWDRE